ncbi:unnamed protein product [Toxocara canis]|uniref:Miff domain-containing protein n=1 Tax=Toxocara canis TaxID=6265 RepID=A0A183UQP4_TOXCA|nr:unnamed protein product [Toxocara canis]
MPVRQDRSQNSVSYYIFSKYVLIYESIFVEGNNDGGLTNANESLREAKLKNASSITLDDIIACARRKVSTGYVEAPMPDNVLSPVRNGRLSRTERESDVLSTSSKSVSSVKEVTRIQDILAEESSFAKKLLDSDSDTFISCEPPSLETDDDLDQMLRASRPTDVYSNPIMYPADPLLTNDRRSHLSDREMSLDFGVVDLSAPNRIGK